MLPIGAIFAFVGRQLGRVLSLAFSWATMALFGRVPEDRQLFLSLMAAASLLWPIVLAGIAVPSFATFLLADPRLREHFLRHHAELLEPDFWQDCQRRIGEGEIVDFFPYPESLRFGNR